MIFKLLSKVEQTQTVSGSHFRITKSSAPVVVTFEGGSKKQKITMEEGMAFTPSGGFKLIRLESQIDQAVHVEATLGQIDDNRMSGTVDVQINPLTGIKSRRITGLVASREVIAQQNAGRSSMIIKNVGADVAYIGGLDVETQGFELAVNESLAIERAAAAEIYASSTTTGTDLHIFEEFDEVQAVTVPADVLTTEIGGSLLTESGEYLTA